MAECFLRQKNLNVKNKLIKECNMHARNKETNKSWRHNTKTISCLYKVLSIYKLASLLSSSSFLSSSLSSSSSMFVRFALIPLRLYYRITLPVLLFVGSTVLENKCIGETEERSEVSFSSQYPSTTSLLI